MQTRLLGPDLKVSQLGLGCMSMAGDPVGHYGAADSGEAIATIHRALDLGITFFDTAEKASADAATKPSSRPNSPFATTMSVK
jgi:aryl-alcohol dehydrogenase-like predicted oxidoreductase